MTALWKTACLAATLLLPAACDDGLEKGFLSPHSATDPYIQAAPRRHISADCQRTDPGDRYNTPSGCLLDSVFTSQIANQQDIHRSRPYNGRGSSASDVIGYIESGGQNE